MSDLSPSTQSNRPFWVAVALCCATFPLIWVGGLVTTYDAGMAVPDWPSTYGYNLFLYPVSTWLSGPFDLFIEHGHRLLGAAAGFITIALVAVTWRYDQRSVVRWFAVACLAGVILQGVIGGVRVLANEVLMARLHGCTGPLFFCMTVAMVAVTSKRWRKFASNPSSQNAGLFRIATIVTALSYGQLVLGSFLRHVPAMTRPADFRGTALAHVLVAFGIAGLSVVLWRASRSANGLPAKLARIVTVLVLLQISLGISTWLVKYNWPTFLPDFGTFDRFIVQDKGFVQGIVTTSHVAMGSLILATSFAISLGCYPAFRLTRQATPQDQASTRNTHIARAKLPMEAIA